MNALRPLVPEDRYRRSPRHLQRAAWAAIRAALGDGPGGRNPVAVAQHLYPGDEVPGLLLRAAISGARTDVAEWLAGLAGHGLADFLTGLGPASAMSEVIRRGVVIPIGENTLLTIPYRSPVAVGGWVGEGAPIPAAQLAVSTTPLVPKKAGVLVTFSRELAKYSGAEAVFTQMLRENAAAVIDSLYLGSAAASADGLAGLLNGVSALASAGSVLGDLEQLAAAVSGTDGSGEVIYIASPGVAATLAVSTTYKPTVLGSIAVPASRLVAISLDGIIHGINPVPDITASIDATLHLSDVPLQIGAAGPVLASPTQSMYQTATGALRLIIDLAYVKRRSNAVAYVDPIAWT